MTDDAPYGFASRLMHKVALGSKGVAQTSFDIDRTMAAKQLDLPRADEIHPVYVTGLARAGTTLLTTLIHQSGLYRSLTYRDMPFVLMPVLWRKLSRSFQSREEKQERAHGDGMLVGYDSPEEFEEVFWRIFCGEDYIFDDRLTPHDVPAETADLYKDYIRRLCAMDGKTRYLAKNNNNVLRLDSLCQFWPQAKIIIAFRDPLPHAQSLLAQHKRFLKQHQEDKFVERYMSWLGHYEFGQNHKPCRFNRDDRPASDERWQTLDVWVEYWCHIYSHLLRYQSKSQVIFVCYEDLCARPEEFLAHLFGKLDLPKAGLRSLAGEISPASRSATDQQADQSRLTEAYEIYKKLRQISVSR